MHHCSPFSAPKKNPLRFSPSHFSDMARPANFDPSSDEAPSNGSISSDEEQRNGDMNPEEDEEELEAVGRTASSDEDEADAPTGDEDDDGSGKTDDEDGEEVDLPLSLISQLILADFFFYECIRVQFFGKEMILILFHRVFENFLRLSPFLGKVFGVLNKILQWMGTAETYRGTFHARMSQCDILVKI